MPASTRNRPVAGGELGNSSGQLRVDDAAVVALGEVLDERFPVGVDVVHDPFGEPKILEAVAFEYLKAAETLEELRLDLCGERISLAFQADPHVTRPRSKANRPETMSRLHGGGHLPKIRSGE